MLSRLSLLTVIAIAGSLAACGGSDASPATTTIAATPPPTSAVTTTPRSTTASTAAPTTALTTPPPPVTTVAPPGDADIDAAVAVWTDAWAAAARFDATVDDIDGAASATVAETLRALTGVDTAKVDVEMTHQIVVTEPTPDGGIGIVDCALLEPHANTPIPTQHLTGTLAPIDGTWTITDVTYHDGGCIPVDTNNAILTAYHAYWEALETSGNPPDPNHPALAEAVGENHLATIRNALRQMSSDGETYVGSPIISAFVAELQADDRALVLDCITFDDHFGYFDTNGTRTWPPSSDPVAVVVEARRTDAGWVVDGRDDQTTCYDDRYRLPVVGD